jgi:neutral ceramidase
LTLALEAGFAKVDITAFERGMGLLGWGREGNVALSVAEPLFARAMVVRSRSTGARVAYACADLCFIAAALRQRVLDLLALEHAPLGLGPHEVMLTATHTHSGPSGFSHAFLYDLAGPGFAPRVFEHLARGIAGAIAEAASAAEPATLSLGSVHIPTAEPIAFNRSLDAFHRNREVRGRLGADRALDRELVVVAAHDGRGRAIGALSLFALHATSVHGDHQALHSDHKGLAARELERLAQATGASDRFVAIAGQGAAGDVSPNYRFDRRRGVRVGRFDDDADSAAYVARVQAAASASVLAELPARGMLLEGPVRGVVRHVDMERHGAARLGLSMAEGTAEGPGPLAPLAPMARLVHRARARRADPKSVLLEVGPGRRARLFGSIDPLSLPIPHPAFAHARRARRAGGGVDPLPWIPTVLPVAILQLGALAIVGLPNEPTTMAGLRLRSAMEDALAPLGVVRVHVTGYTNAYAGYLTTLEEYGAQRYEGAYTLFGARSLDAFEHELRSLARALPAAGDALLGPPLQLCTEAQLAARTR